MPVDYQQIRSSVRSMGQALAGNVRELAERRKRAFDILQKIRRSFLLARKSRTSLAIPTRHPLCNSRSGTAQFLDRLYQINTVHSHRSGWFTDQPQPP